jgi:glycosyltransferase involved in cell wall biosynthesis
MTLNKFSIIGLGVSAWDGPWMNRQQILSRLAAENRVVYSQGSFFSWDRFSPGWWSAPIRSRIISRDGVLVHRRSKLLLRVPRFAALDRFALNCVARFLNRKAGRHSDAVTIAYVFHPSLYPLAKALAADLLVYHAYDRFSSYLDASKDGCERERELTRNADIVIASSNLIAESLRSFTDKDINVIPNGADFEHFAGSDESLNVIPDDFARIPAPRIAYFGDITEKVDVFLIHRLSEARPDWSFVFVGSERLSRQASKDAFEKCIGKSNVYWLERKPYSEIPQYVRATDVNLLTYRVNEGLWSEACSPLKLYEYLAAGRPIVSTQLEIVEKHRDVLAIAQSDQEWLEAIDHAISQGGQGSRESRQSVAQANTWDARILTIKALISKASRDRNT